LVGFIQLLQYISLSIETIIAGTLITTAKDAPYLPVCHVIFLSFPNLDNLFRNVIMQNDLKNKLEESKTLPRKHVPNFV